MLVDCLLISWVTDCAHNRGLLTCLLYRGILNSVKRCRDNCTSRVKLQNDAEILRHNSSFSPMILCIELPVYTFSLV